MSDKLETTNPQDDPTIFDPAIPELMMESIMYDIQDMSEVQRVAILRQHVQELQEDKARMLAELEENVDYKVIKAALKIATEKLDIAEETVRCTYANMTHVLWDGKKWTIDNPKPTDGIVVKVKTTTAYTYDAAAVRVFALEQMKSLLVLDHAKVLLAGQAGLLPDGMFGTGIDRMPQVYIDKDLSALLPKYEHTDDDFRPDGESNDASAE